jgi:uncharacterized protein (DUF2147 family)
MKKIIWALLATFIFSLLLSTKLSAEPADDVLGIWFNEEKDAKIEIYKKNDKYHGKIIWLKEPNKNGKPKIDDENPDADKRNRPIMGLVFMTHFVYDDDYVWKEGTIYDPKKGKTYSCKMTLSKDKNTLNVRGFIGFSLIGRTSVWTRAE